MTNYQPTIPQRVITLFKESFDKGIFKTYREGDPIIFPASLLPAVFVSEPVTDFDEGATGHDDITHLVMMQLVFNKKDEFGAPDGAATLDHKINNIVFGRDPTTGVFLPNTVLGVIRKNITLNNLIFDQKVQVKKYVLPRSETLWTVEAQITMTITEEQEVPNRV